MNTTQELSSVHYRSVIADVPCKHRHKSNLAAMQCARKRINLGESACYLGFGKEYPLALYVRLFYGDGTQVGG